MEEPGEALVPKKIISETLQLQDVLATEDRIERALRMQHLLGERVGNLADVVLNRREVTGPKTTGAFWRELLKRAKGEELSCLTWLNAHKETRNDELLKNLVGLNFGLFGLAERRNEPPLRNISSAKQIIEKAQVEDALIKYLFEQSGFENTISEERLGKQTQFRRWKNPLWEGGSNGEKLKDAYMASLYRRVLTALVPKGRFRIKYSEENARLKMKISEVPGKEEVIERKVIPLLEKFIDAGKTVFDALDIEEPFQQWLNGWNAEALTFLCLSNLGLKAIHPSVPGDIAGIDIEVKLPEGLQLPEPIEDTLGLGARLIRTGKGEEEVDIKFATIQVKSGPFGERALRKQILGIEREEMKQREAEKLPPHDVVLTRIKGKTENDFLLVFPSLSRISQEHILGNPGIFNAYKGSKYVHPGIPTAPMLRAFVQSITREQII